MLRDVYMQVGLGWTMIIGAMVMLTALTWFIAMAGAVTRPMSRNRRAVLLGLLTLLPPSAIVVLARFVAVTRAEYRLRSAGIDRLGGLAPAPVVVHRPPLRKAG